MNVILSVALEGEEVWRDLELSAGRPIHELLPLLVQVIARGEGTPRDWELLAMPSGGRLDLNQTLAESGVWDGAWLLLRPKGSL